MIGAKEFMGRSAIPLAPFIADEGLEEEMWFALGKGEWTNLDGPVSTALIALTALACTHYCTTVA